MRRIFYLTGLLAAASPFVTPASAGEYAILSNGFRLHTDRHEAADGKVRLFTGDGVTELPAGRIERFEPEEYVAPAAPVSPPAAPQPVQPESPKPMTPRELAQDVAKKFSLPEGIVAGVMKAESGFRPAAISPKGAIGLMQLMPGTALELGVDPRNPKENATGGAQYLHDLLVKYQSSPDQVLLALAAYNAGPAAVERYHGVPPYRETREYILRVLKNWKQQEAEAGADPVTSRR